MDDKGQAAEANCVTHSCGIDKFYECHCLRSLMAFLTRSSAKSILSLEI